MPDGRLHIQRLQQQQKRNGMKFKNINLCLGSLESWR